MSDENDTGQMITRRKIAHWVPRNNDSTPEELEEAQRYLRKILEIQCDWKGYRFLPEDIEAKVSAQSDDFFTRDSVALLAEVRVYLTERQDLERKQEEAVNRLTHLARSLASGSLVCEWIETDDDEGGYEETPEQAKERYKVELAHAEANYREITEKLRAMKEAERE